MATATPDRTYTYSYLHEANSAYLNAYIRNRPTLAPAEHQEGGGPQDPDTGGYTRCAVEGRVGPGGASPGRVGRVHGADVGRAASQERERRALIRRGDRVTARRWQHGRGEPGQGRGQIPDLEKFNG